MENLFALLGATIAMLVSICTARRLLSQAVYQRITDQN